MAQDCEKLFERQDIDMHMEMYGEGSLVSELWKKNGRNNTLNMKILSSITIKNF